MSFTLAQWSIDDYHRIVETGILADRQVELIQGQIVEMVPEGPDHVYSEETLAEQFRHYLGNRAYVREAKPITLPDSEPQPDLAIVQGTRDQYRQRHPSPGDIILVVEIAKSTLNTDLSRKRDLYASVAIPEYWIVDLRNRQVYCFWDPQQNHYRHQQRLSQGAIAPQAFPDCCIDIPSLFPE